MNKQFLLTKSGTNTAQTTQRMQTTKLQTPYWHNNPKEIPDTLNPLPIYLKKGHTNGSPKLQTYFQFLPHWPQNKREQSFKPDNKQSQFMVEFLI